MRTRGRFLFKEEFYSICSAHMHSEGIDCKLCETGSWHNVYMLKASQLVYKISPSLWRWWANRPNSKSRKQLKEWFPNLKG